MLLELTKNEYEWLREFLNNYLYLLDTHVLNGTKISDDIKNSLIHMTGKQPEKSGIYVISLWNHTARFLLDLLESNVCACPGCSYSSVKRRNNICTKIYNAFDFEYMEE